jgi:hypothetical protein
MFALKDYGPFHALVPADFAGRYAVKPPEGFVKRIFRGVAAFLGYPGN